MMQLPPYLKPGDQVGIAAPARWVDKNDLSLFYEWIEKQGWKVNTGDVFVRHKQFAGDDTVRLHGLQEMLDDPDIRAVFCARGGYGTARLLEGIDLNRFARHPKWICGFSDITALHAYILIKMGTAVLHGPMPFTLRDGSDREGFDSLVSMLKGELPSYVFAGHKLNRNGKTGGMLLGGNLSVLYSLTGTAYQLPVKGSVLFLEDVDEYLYHIDRMMLNLKMAGMLEGLAGLIVGGMTDMNDNEIPFGETAYEIIRRNTEQYDYPVCFGFPAGHQVPNLALVMGREVSLELNDSGCSLSYT